jgi:hypothetical protein
MLVDHPRSNYRQVPGGRCLILVSDFCIRGGYLMVSMTTMFFASLLLLYPSFYLCGNLHLILIPRLPHIKGSGLLACLSPEPPSIYSFGRTVPAEIWAFHGLVSNILQGTVGTFFFPPMECPHSFLTFVSETPPT